MGGGGGGGAPTTTVTSGVADDVWDSGGKKVFEDVTKHYMDTRNNPEQIVAGLTDDQTKANTQLRGIAADMAAGKGAYDFSDMLHGKGSYDYADAVDRTLQKTGASQDIGAAAAGNLGSARADAMKYGAMADRAGEWQQLRNQDKEKAQGYMDAARRGGAEILSGVGSSIRDYNQMTLDAPHTAASRFFGYLGSAPQSSTTKQEGGGK